MGTELATVEQAVAVPRSDIPEPEHFELYTRDRRKQILSSLLPKWEARCDCGDVQAGSEDDVKKWEASHLKKVKAGESHIVEVEPSDVVGSFPNDAARYAGISPSLLQKWLEHGTIYPNGPLGRFNREFKRIMAYKNDIIRRDVYETAKGKKWEGLARIGEQMDAETWSRPDGGTTVNVGISITDRIADVHATRGKTLTGD